MSRIFLSHSSVDEIEAVAVKQWLLDNGWDDVFLDIDPERGLTAGERWQEALRRAADRCEAVVFIVSPAWAKSKWCLAEFLLAKSLNKLIFGVVLKAVPIGELPTEMTAEWQLCHLVGEGPKETIRFTHRENAAEIAFLADGLKRLRSGLQSGGLSASFFAWPPKGDESRSPYRGLEPLDAQDAAVFFGRDAEILQGLDRVRGMRAASNQPLLVILGASGAGKSSFLRAGLFPRLARDARHFFPLEVIRPERRPLFGERGLAQAISKANRQLQLAPLNPGDVKMALKESAERFAELLHNIQAAARARLVALPHDAPSPTIVLPVDQAEELFNADATEEARVFLDLIGTVLRGGLVEDESKLGMPLIVVFTIRSDRYEPLQTAVELAGLKTVVFDALKPMPPAQFKEVIVGPANRATVGGSRLEIKPDLVRQLLSDCAQGADTLPLLSLTLARLYKDYGNDGNLRLDEYQSMGGMADVINTEAESVLCTDVKTHKAELEALHAAFIPWLATINVDNDQLMRRVARMSDLPPVSRPLVQALIEKRLLLSDLRNGEQVVEVAHESLLRQWNTLAGWLREEREDLKEADRLEHAAAAWGKSSKKAAWLMEGERLAIAEAVGAKPAYRRRLEPISEFLLASRQRETQRHEEEEHRRQTELVVAQEKQALAEAMAVDQLRATARAQTDATRLRKRGRQLIGLVLAAVVVALVAWRYALKADQEFKQATALRLNAETQAMLSGTNAGGPVLGLLKLLAAHRISAHVEIESSMQTSVLAFDRLEKIIDAASGVGIVAFSPNGERMVSGGDKGLQVWDVKSGQPIGAPMHGHEEEVSSVAFSPDGARIVSARGGFLDGGKDNTLRLWDANSGQPIGAPMHHEKQVTSVAFSRDGARIVSGSNDGTLRVWDAKSGQPIDAPISSHPYAPNSVVFSPDGTQILSGSSHTLRLWDADSGLPIGAPMQGHGEVMSVAFSPSGARIVSGGDDMTLQLWGAKSRKPIGAPMKGHDGVVVSVAFSPDGTRIVSASSDFVGGKGSMLLLWDAESGRPIGAPMRGHKGLVTSVAFSPDGTRIVSASWDVREGKDNTLRFWNIKSSKHIGVPMYGHKNAVSSVAFSPDGTRIVSGSRRVFMVDGEEDNTLRLWDAETGEPIGAPMQGHKDSVRAVNFSPDGTRILSGSEDSTLRLWDAKSGEPIGGPMEGHKDAVTSVAFSADGTRIVSGSRDKTLQLWDTDSRQPIGAPMQGHDREVTSVAFSPDGARIVSGSDDHTLRVWDARSGQPIGAPMRGHKGWVMSVAFSLDGRRIVSGGGDLLGVEDNSVRVWDAQNGQPVGGPMQGHNGTVSSVAFSPDGAHIVSASWDKTLRLWDAKSGQPIGAPMQGHEEQVSSAAFSPDGMRIVSGSWDHTLRVWLAPDAWPRELCAKLRRNMSRKEWREWVSPEIPYLCQCPGLPIPADDPRPSAKAETCPAGKS